MSHTTIDPSRGTLLKSAAAGLAVSATGRARAASERASTGTSDLTSTTSIVKPTPGKAGDFDFLAGEWKIQHRRLKTMGSDGWDEFEGEATCWTILDGVGSVEELRIPARRFSGMGLRLLDVEQRVWRDVWVNGKSGVLTAPGMPGHFVDGVGTFIADDTDGEKPMKVRGVWDRITPMSCRWHQAVSYDAGKTWQDNWVMAWTRV